MSAESKEAAKKAGANLESAGAYLKEAEKHAQNTGDKKLVERVTKIVKETDSISKEIKTNLDPKNG